MNILSKKTRRIISCVTLCSVLSLPTYADCTVCDLNNSIWAWGSNIYYAINRIYDLLNTALNATYNDLSYYPPNLQDNLTIGKQITPPSASGNYTSVVGQNAINGGWLGVTGSIGPLNLLPDNQSSQSSIKFNLTSLIGGDTWDEALSSGSSGDSAAYLANQSCGNYNMSFESLVSPLTYRTIQMSCDSSSPSRTNRNQAAYALNYIQLISDSTDPISSLTPITAFSTGTPSSDNIKALINDRSGVYQTFTSARRSWLAGWSAVYNNLYYLYTLHSIPIDASGNQIGNDSPNEIAARIATRRTSNPQWYADVHGAAGPVLQRETVFILAEIQRDLNEMRRENQRILGLQAVQVALGLKQMKQFIKPMELAVRNKAQSIMTSSTEKKGKNKPTIPRELIQEYKSD